MGPFFQAFLATLESLFDIVLVVVVAGLLVRRNVVTQEHISALSRLTVAVFLPCLMFANVMAQFDPSRLAYWWVIVLLGAGFSLAGLVLAALVYAPHWREKRDMLPLASMQNAGYLVLPVGLKLVPESFDQFALYCFLFILGFNPVLWSVGKYLMTRPGERREGWRGLLTPPLVANLVAVVLVLTTAARWVPRPVTDGVALLGQAAVPVATFVLGAVLGGIALRIRPYLADACRTVVVKLILFPFLVAAVMALIELDGTDPLLARFLIIEASAAPAVALILQVRSYGGNEQKISSIMFVHYALCLVTLPAWVALWQVWTH